MQELLTNIREEANMGGFATLGFVDEYENPLFMKHCLSLFERFAGYITEITYHYPCDESCEV